MKDGLITGWNWRQGNGALRQKELKREGGQNSQKLQGWPEGAESHQMSAKNKVEQCLCMMLKWTVSSVMLMCLCQNTVVSRSLWMGFFKVSGTKTKGYSSKLTWKKKKQPRGSMPLGRKLANGISTQTGLLFPDCVPKQHNDALD